MTDVRTTLIDLAERRGISLAALSRMVGRNDAYLQQFVTRGSPRRLDDRAIELLAAFFGVAPATLGGAHDDMVVVPRYDAEAAAGAGRAGDDRVIGEERVDPRVVARLGVAAAALTLIVARGTSMEPTIADGDALFVDTGDRRLSSRPGLFVLRLDGDLLVKRVARIGHDLRIASDNPAAPPVDPTRFARIDVIGRVVRLARTLK